MFLCCTLLVCLLRGPHLKFSTYAGQSPCQSIYSSFCKCLWPITVSTSMDPANDMGMLCVGGRPQQLDFPQPETPESINHGSEDGGFNFGGSMGFLYEIMAVHGAVVNGHRGYPDVSKEEIIQVMDVADEIRRQIGVKYPQDD